MEIISEGIVENGIKLTYRVPDETLFHSPGSVVTNKNGKIHVSFPRVHIDATELNVDVNSIVNDDGTVSVTVPAEIQQNQPVEILLNGEKTLGSWTADPTQ